MRNLPEEKAKFIILSHNTKCCLHNKTAYERSVSNDKLSDIYCFDNDVWCFM